MPNTQSYQLNAVKVEPKIFKQAIKSGGHDLWGKAIKKEIDAFMRNSMLESVVRPGDRNFVSSKWVFKIKHKSDSLIECSKAHLVTEGFSKQPGIEYDDTYASVARYDSLRLLLALAAPKRWKPRQLNVESAFLYRNLDREIDM